MGRGVKIWLARIIILLALALIATHPTLAATYYVDATSGNDSSAGTSEGTAWQTISKVNSESFNPGDQILFKRGELWREMLDPPSSGNTTHRISFDAYGSGEKPMMIGSDIITGWTLNTTNIWQANITGSVYGMFFDNTTGKEEDDFSNLDNERDWNYTDGKVFIYSSTDPTNTYTEIEAATRYYAIYSQSENYLEFKNIRIEKAVDGIRLRFTDDSLIENLTCIGRLGTCLYIRNNVNATARYNNISTPNEDMEYQTDGIYSQLNVNNSYHNNHITIANYNVVGHDDGIQMYQDTGTRIYNNYIEQQNNKTSNAQGIYQTAGEGVSYYYNNIVFMNGARSNAMHYGEYAGSNGSVRMYNNIIYQNHPNLDNSYQKGIGLDGTNGSEIKNNLLYSVSTNRSYLILVDNSPTNLAVDYNLVYAPNASYILYINNTPITNWASWQAQGVDANGYNTNPLLADPENRNFTVLEGSDAINNGDNLGETFNDSYNGITRPQGLGWDIGAFEFEEEESNTTKYVTPTGAGNHDGTPGNEWTLKEASENAVAGDTVIIAKGEYLINGTNALDKIVFGNSGTPENPIIFVGEFDEGYVPETADGDTTSYIHSTYSVTNAITISGDYIILRNLNMAQGVNITKTLIDVTGDNVTIEDSIVKYLNITSGDHTITVSPSAQNFTLRNSFLHYGGRTIIWAESNNDEGADGILIDNNTFVHNDNHNAIQIMPLTTYDPGYKIKNATIRNNLFRNCTYSNNILLRHNEDTKIYNNVFLNSGNIKLEPHNYGDQTTSGILIAYNTFIDDGTYPLYNQAMQGVTWKNNLVLSTTSLGGYIYRFLCASNISPTQNHSMDYNLYYDDGDTDFSDATVAWHTNPDCTGSTTLSWSSWTTTYGQDNHTTVNQRPEFLDESGNDFRPLNSGSPQVGTGTPLPEITTDKNGIVRNTTSPTIGAYEFVSTNPVPEITITNPENYALYRNNTNISLNVTANISSGSIISVEFYINNTLIANDTTEPYSTTWKNETPGIYSFTATAVSDLGETASETTYINNSEYIIIYASNRTSGGSGTFEDPYTFNGALSAATSGDTVMLLPGNYTTGGGYFITKSGINETHRFTVQGYNSSDKPILTGNTSMVTQLLEIQGDYTTLKDVITQQQSNGRQVISISADHVTLDGVESHYLGTTYSSSNHNINVYSSDYFILNNSLLHRSSRNGLYIASYYPTGTSNYCIIENSEFRNLEDHHAINIFPNTVDDPLLPIEGCVIRNNYIHDLPNQSGVFVRNFEDFQIYNNVFVNVGNGISISSGDYVTDSYDANGTIANNHFINITNGYGIINWVANNLTVVNNIFTGDYYSTTDNVIRFDENFIDPDTDGAPIYNHTINNNIYWNSTEEIAWDWYDTTYTSLAAFTAATGHDSESFYSDPLLVDEEGLNYTLQESSDAIDSGFDLSAIFDYDHYRNARPDGNAWDIGAYESSYTADVSSPPSVSITSPANNDYFEEYENVTVNATASDSGGSITYVEFYANGTLIGNDSVSEYSIIWESPATGYYSLIAIAYDNESLNTTSSSVIIRVNTSSASIPGIHFNDTFTDTDGTNLTEHTPEIGTGWAYGEQRGSVIANITGNNVGPAPSDSFNAGFIILAGEDVPSANYNVSITAVNLDSGDDMTTLVARWQDTNNYYAWMTASNQDRGITKVYSGVATQINTSGCSIPSDGSVLTLSVYDSTISVYDDGILVCSATDSSISSAGKGGFGHGATIADTGGDFSQQESDNFNIVYPYTSESTNIVPEISITNPSNGTTYSNQSNIAVNATATDADGTISYVEFYANSTLIGNDTTSPYGLTWNSVDSGAYSLTATAYDNDSDSNTSNPVIIIVNSTEYPEEDSLLNITINYSIFTNYTNMTGKNRSQLSNLSGVNFSNEFAYLLFTDNITLQRNISMIGEFLIENMSVYINSTHIPEFNVSANITFFDVNMTYPVAYRNGAVCGLTYCVNASHNSSSLEFSYSVTGFSNYSVQEASCGDYVCNGAETCSICSADCGACDSEDSGGGGSGGGGGGGFGSAPSANPDNTTTNESSNTKPDDEDILPTPNADQEPEDEVPQTEEIPGLIQQEEQRNPNIPILVGAITILVGFTAFYVFRKISKPHPHNIDASLFKRCKDYTMNLRNKGVSDSDIIKRFKDSGWSDEQINYLFKKFK